MENLHRDFVVSYLKELATRLKQNQKETIAARILAAVDIIEADLVNMPPTIYENGNWFSVELVPSGI